MLTALHASAVSEGLKNSQTCPKLSGADVNSTHTHVPSTSGNTTGNIVTFSYVLTLTGTCDQTAIQNAITAYVAGQPGVVPGTTSVSAPCTPFQVCPTLLNTPRVGTKLCLGTSHPACLHAMANSPQSLSFPIDAQILKYSAHPQGRRRSLLTTYQGVVVTGQFSCTTNDKWCAMHAPTTLGVAFCFWRNTCQHVYHILFLAAPT
jgi:hypothetical protein